MAKSKKPKKADAEEEVIEETDAKADDQEAEAEDVEIDADDADAEAEDVEVDADADGEDAEVEADADEEKADAEDDEAKGEGDDDDADDDEASVDDTPPKPTPKITTTATVLIFLNMIAAVVFLCFAYVDHMGRAKAQYRTLINYVKIWGLPLKQDDGMPTVASVTRPVNRLTSEQLASAFRERGTKVTISDKFQPVEEALIFHIQPSDMSELVLKDVFYGDTSNLVPTLDDEIIRLKTAVPAKISEAATEVADTLLKKPDAEKRTFVKKNLAIVGDAAQIKALEDQIDGAGGAALDDFVKRAIVQRTLFPLAFSVPQVDKLDEMLKAKKGADLDKLVNESIQRRMYYDILAPLNVFRPGDISDPKRMFEIEKLASQSVTIDDLKKLLDKRFDASIAEQYAIEDAHLGKDFWTKVQPGELSRARDANEKRKHIGFILFTLSQVQRPLIGAKVIPQGVERAQMCSGLYEFTNASIQYVGAINVLDDRIARATEADRQGRNYTIDGKTSRTPGAIDKYEQEVERLIKIRERIEIATERLGVVKKQRDHFIKIYEERAKQYQETLDRLITERARTEKYAKELRELQNQLHEALLNLADAGERNFQIEGEIRAIEMEFIRRTQPKGVKQP